MFLLTFSNEFFSDMLVSLSSNPYPQNVWLVEHLFHPMSFMFYCIASTVVYFNMTVCKFWEGTHWWDFKQRILLKWLNFNIWVQLNGIPKYNLSTLFWQLARQLKKGRAFDGWSEGVLNFPPTYKYDMNSDKYYGEDPKGGRRTPAW